MQHLAQGSGATFFRPDTPGVEINESVRPLPAEALIQKHYPNAFRDTDLKEALTDAGVKEVIIGGAMSHMCIDATTRAAFDYGFKCTVIHDACATRDLVFEGLTIPAAHVHGGAGARGPAEGLVAGDLPDLVALVLSGLRPSPGGREGRRG